MLRIDGCPITPISWWNIGRPRAAQAIATILLFSSCRSMTVLSAWPANTCLILAISLGALLILSPLRNLGHTPLVPEGTGRCNCAEGLLTWVVLARPVWVLLEASSAGFRRPWLIQRVYWERGRTHKFKDAALLEFGGRSCHFPVVDRVAIEAF
jgi:hypothetical protein